MAVGLFKGHAKEVAGIASNKASDIAHLIERQAYTAVKGKAKQALG